MQISSNKLTPSNSDRLSQALTTLKRAAQDWDNAESRQTSADRFIKSSEREFRWADSPARQASFDNGNRDSSHYGRQLDRHFRTGERQLDSGQRELRTADNHLGQSTRNIDSGQLTLQQLAQEYRESGDPRLADVQAAQRELLSTEQSFTSVDRTWGRVENDIRFTKPDINRSSHDIRQISWDRPGQDVSMYGRRVSSNLNSIQSDLRRLEFDFRRAVQDGNSGEQHLDRAIAILEEATRQD